MPDRQSLVSTIWLTSVLTLLAWVLAAPIPTSGSVTISAPVDGPHPNRVLPPGQPTTCLSSTVPPNDVFDVNALPTEDEEQDRADAAHEPRPSFLIPCSLRKVFARKLIAPRSILSLYPLRC